MAAISKRSAACIKWIYGVRVANFGALLRQNRERLGITIENAEKVSRNFQPHRDEPLVRAEIREAAVKRDWDAANSLFQGIDAPSAHCYGAILHAADRCERLQHAEALFTEMKDDRIIPRIGTYTSLINLNSRRGDMDRVHDILLEMQAQGTVADVMVYSAILNGQAKRGDIIAASNTWQEMVNAGVKPTAVAFISLLNVYAQAGRPDLAIERLTEMRSHGLQPLTTHWNVLLKACQQKPDSSAALRELQRMKEAGTPPNIASYTSVLVAISREHGHDWESKAEALFKSMTEDGIAPDSHFFEVRVRARLAACGEVQLKMINLQVVDLQILQACAADFNEARALGLVLNKRVLQLERALLRELGLRESEGTSNNSVSGDGEWVQVVSKSHGCYFWDKASGITQWERPLNRQIPVVTVE